MWLILCDFLELIYDKFKSCFWYLNVQQLEDFVCGVMSVQPEQEGIFF
jgi:hypothetical protein